MFDSPESREWRHFVSNGHVCETRVDHHWQWYLPDFCRDSLDVAWHWYFSLGRRGDSVGYYSSCPRGPPTFHVPEKDFVRDSCYTNSFENWSETVSKRTKLPRLVWVSEEWLELTLRTPWKRREQ